MKAANIDALTGLRGIAAWLVVLYHFKEFSESLLYEPINFLIRYGYLAVDLFFILSGLVLYINYQHHFENFQIRTAVDFYIKRIARIYPLHIAVLVFFLINPVVIILFSSSGNISRYSPEYLFLSVFLIQNWGFTSTLEWNIPAWSISAEFGAYLLFPFLVMLVKRSAKLSSWIPIIFYLLLIIGIAGIYQARGLVTLDQDISRLGLARCLLGFSMGLIVGFYYVLNREWFTRMAGKSLFLLSVGLVAVVFADKKSADYFIAPLLLTLTILSMLDVRSRWCRIFASRALTYLGEISFSTYMIHYFVKDWVKFLSQEVGWLQYIAYLFVVFLSSVLLYRWVEYPFRIRFYEVLSRCFGGGKNAQ